MRKRHRKTPAAFQRSAHQSPVQRVQVLAVLLLLFLPLTPACKNSDSPETSPRGAETTAAPAGMRLVPGGLFFMGDSAPEAKPDCRPVHEVYVDAFYIDTCEVTNRSYQRFLRDTGHPAPFFDSESAAPWCWKGTDYPAGTGDHPVVLVSWHDARAYSRWCGKRLPTEAEWEKAARGGLTGAAYPFGETLSLGQASFDKGLVRGRRIEPVGSYPANGYGLHDMAGNVWEWCQDWYDPKYYRSSPKRNPAGPVNGFYRVLRGGAWDRDVAFLRCSWRGKNVPECRSVSIGFRCALSARAADLE